ncbi:ornithine carbamoyltransferase [Desertibaculum subflavum]|uniref:ornithine carbamoyltransferase n=1 Tax=Desertibaculum subflavum TaxID=2268458 RepID=UPI000E66263C
MGGVRHFIDLDRLEGRTLRSILDKAAAMKRGRNGAPKGAPDHDKPLAGRVLAMIFEKASTRTRLSFDIAMRQLGGEGIVMNAADLQIGRGESASDTAKVLSRYVDAIMIRTHKSAMLEEMVANATVPVINGLTDDSHPCQLMADVLTFEEKKGPIAGKVVTWSGDGNNVARSWVHAAVRFDFELRLACPEPLSPSAEILDWARREGGRVRLVHDARAAAAGADAVVTDAWVSMGQKAGDRHNLLKPFQVDRHVMAAAKPDAVFMHCLPAHRGEEVTAEVIDGPQSIVFDEAENRLHAQKGILAWCMA